MSSGSRTLSRMRMRGLSAALGSWKTIWKSRRLRRKARAAERVGIGVVQLQRAGRRLQQADDGAPKRRLARAGFADDAERLAAAHGEADAVDRLHRLGRRRRSEKCTRRSAASTRVVMRWRPAGCRLAWRMQRRAPSGGSVEQIAAARQHSGAPCVQRGAKAAARRHVGERAARGRRSRAARVLRGLRRGIERSRPDV